jgi:hypothetical protein
LHMSDYHHIKCQYNDAFLMIHISTWRWRYDVLLKHQFWSTGLHGVITQNTIIWTIYKNVF